MVMWCAELHRDHVITGAVHQGFAGVSTTGFSTPGATRGQLAATRPQCCLTIA
jgi:hypothetical protein